MIRRSLEVAAICWILAVVSVFVLSSVVPRWPRWLELPWSSFDDFAVTPAGEVLVYSSSFQQLLVYSLEGDFQTSLPGIRGSGGRYLAVDVKGRVYVGATPAICEAGPLGSDDFSFRCHGGEKRGVTGWWLSDTGEAEPTTSSATAPDRAIRAGEALLTFDSRGRRRFDLESGGWVERHGDRLTVHPATGESVTLSTPWYLYWAKFPFPGALAWVLAVVIGATESRRRRRATPTQRSGARGSRSE